MIKLRDFYQWETNNSNNDLFLIAISFDPEKREKIYKQGYFDRETIISDKKKFVKILSSIIKLNSIEKFRISLRSNYSWFPSSIKKGKENKQIKKYLDNIEWKNNQYFGSFVCNDLKEFLNIFIKIPFKYQYQDILINSIDRNLIIVLSNHGTVWIIGRDKKNLLEIGTYLEKEGSTVLMKGKPISSCRA